MIDEVASVNKDMGISALWSQAAKLSTNPCDLKLVLLPWVSDQSPAGQHPRPPAAEPVEPLDF